MRVLVDLDKVVVTVAEPQDLAEISVVVASPPDASGASEATVHRLGDVLAAAGVGRIQPDGTVVLRADALQFHAAGQVDADWAPRLAGMCDDGGTGAVLVVGAPVIWPAS